MESGKEKEVKSSASVIAKWSGIVIITITSLLVLHTPIAKLVDRISGIEYGKLKIQTIQTAFGPTTVSSVPTAIESVGREGFYKTYVNEQYRFQISWLDDGCWIPNEAYGEKILDAIGAGPEVNIPIVILHKDSINHCLPNVNVAIEPEKEDFCFIAYIDTTKKQLERIGWKILSAKIDTATKSCILIYNNALNNYQFQKIISYSNAIYAVTATGLPPHKELSEKIKKDLGVIINSFHLIQ
jgi:hypothetical protein